MKITYLIAALLFSQLAFAHGEQHKKMHSQVTYQQEDWGIGAKKDEVNRTIQLTMGDDMKFKPEKIDIKMGETIRFEIKNNGKLKQGAELVIDDGNGNVLAKQHIRYTDFPLDSMRLYACWGEERWIILLPSEY